VSWYNNSVYKSNAYQEGLRIFADPEYILSLSQNLNEFASEYEMSKATIAVVGVCFVSYSVIHTIIHLKSSGNYMHNLL
jgi:hypothetical protein